jgi:hypothetical protein
MMIKLALFYRRHSFAKRTSRLYDQAYQNTVLRIEEVMNKC